MSAQLESGGRAIVTGARVDRYATGDLLHDGLEGFHPLRGIQRDRLTCASEWSQTVYRTLIQEKTYELPRSIRIDRLIGMESCNGGGEHSS